jgi:hypothetical protein
MGNNLVIDHNFVIDHSIGKEMKKVNEITNCSEAINTVKTKFRKYINQIKNSSDYEIRKDYDKYHLHPGQQIRRRLRKHILIPHPAIYIFKGMIIEMGVGPKSCKKSLGHPLTNNKNMLTISTLDEFLKFLNNSVSGRNEKVTVIEEDDYSKNACLNRLKRAYNLIGEIEYNFFLNNCIHVSNYISTGKKSLIIFGRKKSEYRRFGKRKTRSRRSRVKRYT